MSVKWSDAVRNAVVDAIETAIGASPKVRFYSGVEPADETAALSGNTMLAEFTLGADWAANGAAGVKTFSGTPLTATGAAAGVASFYRIYNNAGTTCHEQGSLGTSGTDMTIDNTNIAVGQTVRITGWTKTAPH